MKVRPLKKGRVSASVDRRLESCTAGVCPGRGSTCRYDTLSWGNEDDVETEAMKASHTTWN